MTCSTQRNNLLHGSLMFVLRTMSTKVVYLQQKPPSPSNRRRIYHLSSLLSPLERHGGEQLPPPRRRPIWRGQDGPRVGGVRVHVPHASERPDRCHDGLAVRVADLQHREVGGECGRGVPPLHPPPRRRERGAPEPSIQVLPVLLRAAILQEPHHVPGSRRGQGSPLAAHAAAAVGGAGGQGQDAEREEEHGEQGCVR
jgi:hypothetical protein